MAFRRVEIPAYVVASVSLIICTLCSGLRTTAGFVAMQTFLITGVVALFCIASRLVDRGVRIPQLLMSSTFIIYAAHVILVKDFCVRVLNEVFRYPTNVVLQLVVGILTPVLMIAVCVGIYLVMKLLCPTVLAILTGGRINRQNEGKN